MLRFSQLVSSATACDRSFLHAGGGTPMPPTPSPYRPDNMVGYWLVVVGTAALAFAFATAVSAIVILNADPSGSNGAAGFIFVFTVLACPAGLLFLIFGAIGIAT